MSQLGKILKSRRLIDWLITIISGMIVAVFSVLFKSFYDGEVKFGNLIYRLREILENPWLIGIISGTIAGILSIWLVRVWERRSNATHNRVPENLLDQSRTTLVQNKWGEADQLAVKFEKQAIQDAAKAAHLRSRIVLDEIKHQKDNLPQHHRVVLDENRYKVSYAHVQRAVEFAPENGFYLRVWIALASSNVC